MPKWLLATRAKSLLPLLDSNRPCANVILAGTPYKFISCMAIVLKRSIYCSEVKVGALEMASLRCFCRASLLRLASRPETDDDTIFLWDEQELSNNTPNASIAIPHAIK